jgi:inosose dehydratase
MGVRIGINPLTWTNDDLPALGGDTPLEQCLSEGKQAGFAGFELGHKFPRDPALLRPILAAHGLVLVSGWYSSRLLERSVEQEIEAMQEHLQLLKAMGCQVMVLCEVSGCVHGEIDTPVSQRPLLAEQAWPLFCERLDALGRYLQTQGVRLAYHHHMGTVIERASEVDRLMQNTSAAVGLLLDSGHLTFAGDDPLEVLRRWGPRVCHVHCKDVRAEVLAQMKAQDCSFLDAVLAGVFTVPGDGSIDYRPLLAELKPLNYQGWLVVEAEQDPAKAHPLTYARKGYSYLDELVASLAL